MFVSPSCNLRRKLLDQFALSHSLLSHACVCVCVCVCVCRHDKLSFEPQTRRFNTSLLASVLLGAECNVGSHGLCKACDARMKPRKPCWRCMQADDGTVFKHVCNSAVGHNSVSSYYRNTCSRHVTICTVHCTECLDH